MGINKRLSILICTTLMFSLMFSAVTPALAKSAREAIIDTVVGEVNVTKAGGSKSYSAFEGMALNQGDHIETGVDSKVVLRIVDHDDEITIDEKSSLYISELSEDTKGKKSKMKMWAGSLWGKVKTLTGTDDEFEVETPTAVMGVRGTNLLVGVDPETGESKFYIASGVGNISTKDGDDSDGGTILNANEQISLDKDTKASDLDDYKNVADLDVLISNTSGAIIEAIVASKAAIDKENSDYVENLKNGQAGVIDQVAIDRITQNLNNLVGNIVNNAITQNKVEKADIQTLIDKINKDLDKKLDLATVKDQVLSDQEKAKQAKIESLVEVRKQKQEEEKLKQEVLKKQNEELQKKLQGQLEKQKVEKQKAEEASKKKAIEEYAKKLTDGAARLAFEAKQKEIANEKAKQDSAAAKAAADAAAKAADAATKAAADAAAAAAAAAAQSDDDDPNPQLSMSIVQGIEGAPAKLNIYLNDFENLGVYAAELHFTHSSNIYTYGIESLNSELFTVNDPEFVYLVKDSNYEAIDHQTMTESMFVITKYDSNDINVVADRKLLVSLDFGASQAGTISLAKVIIVDHNGTRRSFDINTTAVTINATNTGD